jgi:hypothetical protein
VVGCEYGAEGSQRTALQIVHTAVTEAALAEHEYVGAGLIEAAIAAWLPPARDRKQAAQRSRGPVGRRRGRPRLTAIRISQMSVPALVVTSSGSRTPDQTHVMLCSVRPLTQWCSTPTRPV